MARTVSPVSTISNRIRIYSRYSKSKIYSTFNANIWGIQNAYNEVDALTDKNMNEKKKSRQKPCTYPIKLFKFHKVLNIVTNSLSNSNSWRPGAMDGDKKEKLPNASPALCQNKMNVTRCGEGSKMFIKQSRTKHLSCTLTCLQEDVERHEDYS